MCALLFTACTDEIATDIGEIDGSRRDISVEVSFTPENSVDLASRAVEDEAMSPQAGDAIQNINDFRMLIYNDKDNLIANLKIRDNKQNITSIKNGDIEIYNVNYNLDDNRIDSEKNSGYEEKSSGKLTYNFKIRTGNYRIYAVANVPDFPDGITDSSISTPERLKSIKRTWDTEDISKNSEMFGVFSLKPNREANDESTISITNKTASIHSWLRRLASKITVSFDGSELYDNVQIYIESIALKDIPKECTLGNPNIPGIDDPDYVFSNLTEENKAPKTKDWSQHTNYLITNGGFDKIQEINTNADFASDEFYHVCNERHPYLGKGNDDKPLTSSDNPEMYDTYHSHPQKAFFFYENMQGKGKDKRQDANEDGKVDYPTPVEGNLTSGWKDHKPYGSYIEVKGFYKCNDIGSHHSSGPITYRFMLGKDVTTDYNAERNHHYKLKLKFKGYGNDADWHIVYEDKKKIEIQSPMYISYLFNKKMMATVRVSGILPEGAKLRAEIVECSWKPWGNGTKSFPIPPTSFYADIPAKFNTTLGTIKEVEDGPWNSFLSLKKTKVVKLEIPGKEDMPSNQYEFAESWIYNKDYFKGTAVGANGINRGLRIYDTSTGKGGQQSYDSNDGDGIYFVSELQSEGSGDNKVVTERLFTIPFYTRAKELITRISFTGNNPYTSYPRKGRVKFTVVKSDGKTEVEGFEPAYLDIIQVRQVVNPKGVWRKAGSTEEFHVTLMRLIDENSDFSEFNSEGKWSAEIFPENAGIITLSTTTKGSGNGNKMQNYVTRIEGESEHPIDFKINFTGTSGAAIVRVRYHNYTCEHDIYCREGYDPVDVKGDGKHWWPSFNVDHFDGTKAVYTKSPLQQGSYFRFGNYTAILAENDERPGFGFNEAPSENFKVMKNDGTATELGWSQITPVKDASSPSNWLIANTDERIPTGDDFYEFVAADATDIDFKISKAYGVLYGDGATETQSKRILAYGYNRTDGVPDKRGMRGVFVYNNITGNHIFFPIGVTGYGHRQFLNGNNVGALRYAGREAIMSLSESTHYLKERPLFYDLYMRPGAVYWLQHFYSPVPQITKYTVGDDGKKKEIKYIDSKKSSAFDMNYFTMGFEGYGGNDAIPNDDINKSHGCFIRTVRTTSTPPAK